MASGTINGSCDNRRYILTCEWTSTPNTSANTSSITAKVYLNGNGYTTSSSYWSCVINGTTVTSNKNASIGGKTLLGTRTWTVNHNNDGTASVGISFSYSNGLNSSGTYTTKTGSGSATVRLDTIARGSSISLSRSSATIGSDSITVNITRNSSAYKHKVKLILGDTTYLLAENVDTSYTFTPSMSYCNKITTATSGTATVKVETLTGTNGSWIAETTKTLTLNVPSNVVPSVGISVVANNQTNGVSVADKTTFTVKPVNANGSYGSTITSYSITGGNLNSVSPNGTTTGTLNAGDYTFVVKVTDSRGRTAEASKVETVHAYSSPTISARAFRCNKDGTESSSGVYIAVNFSWEITNLANNNSNAKQYFIQYKTSSASSYTTSVDWTNLSSYSGSMTKVLSQTFSTTSSYNIQLKVKDSFGTTTSTLSVSTISALLNIEKNGVGVGKIHENGALDVAGAIYMNGQPVMTSLERPVSGNWFRGTPSVSGDGVMEIGKYIDFHDSNSTTADFSVRLTTNGSMLTSSGTLEAPIIKATGNGKSGELGTGGGDVYLHNTKGNSYWQFKDNGHFGLPNHLVFQGSSERRIFLEGTNKGLYFNSGSFGFYDWANNTPLFRIDLSNKEIRTDSGYFATGGTRMITSRSGSGYISWGNSTDWKYSCAFYTNTSNDAAASSLTKGAPTIKMYSGSGGGLHLFPAGDAAGGTVICKGTGWGSYGDITCNKTYNMSDMRLKKNIKPLDDPSAQIKMLSLNEEETTGSVALDIIKKAKVYSYMHTYDDDSLNNSFGLMAQDLPVELTKQYIPKETSNLSLEEGKEEDYTGTTMRTKKERNDREEDIAVDVYGVASIAWEGVRVLLERIELLEKELQAIKRL
ncbi:MAG: tail fiber domain-containing protein [Lachnospiraceae bacterium]|nr:tail fiber domain-containing protein [Lachnospiraceae bacterium]